METLVLKDTQDLHRAIQQIYSLHDRATFGVQALAIVDRLVPSDTPLFQITNVQTGVVDATFLPDCDWASPENLLLVAEVFPRYIHEHPIAQNMPYTLNGVHKISDFLTAAELHQSEGIYQQFLRLLETEDQMQFFLPVAQPGTWQQLAEVNTMQAGFVLNRSQRTFTERDRLMLNLLWPHISQAYNDALKYQQHNQFQQSLGYLGLITLDAVGHVQWMTMQAESCLQRYFAKSTAIDGLPDQLVDWLTHQLTQSIDRPLVRVPFTIEQAGKKLVIRFVADREHDRYTLMLEEETTLPLECLPRLGLSKRETEVMGWLMQGKDNKAIAMEMGIHVGTIRKHLENIYRKLDVQSRTEAIACALEKLGWLS
jgi:DNA-binding CsgD family transcriptional regulator